MAGAVDRATGTSERAHEAWVAHHDRLWRSLLAVSSATWAAWLENGGVVAVTMATWVTVLGIGRREAAAPVASVAGGD